MAELRAAAGWSYRVATEPDPVAIRNVRYLAVGRRAPTLVPHWPSIVADAARFVKMTIEEAASRLRGERSPNLAMPCVAGLVWWGHLRVGLMVPIGAHTVLKEG